MASGSISIHVFGVAYDEEGVIYLPIMENSPSLHLSGPREHILAAVQAADAVVPSSASKPIASYLQLEARDGSLVVNATDLQVGLRAIASQVAVQSPGQVVVQSRQLAMILRESSSREVSLRMERKGDQAHLSIIFDDGDYQVPAVLNEHLPPVSEFPADAGVIPVPGARFEEMMTQTAFAMEKDRSSAVLAGLLMVIGKGELTFAGTDGKVLGEAVEKGKDYVWNRDGADSHQTVLPALTVSHLQRLVGALKPDRVDIAFVSKLAFVRLRAPGGLSVEVTSRTVEGSYPPYAAALRRSADVATITFDTKALAGAIRRVAMMIQTTTKAIVLELDRDKAVFSNLNFTNGSARITVPCQYSGAPTRIGLNGQYMGEVLRVYRAEKLTLEMSKGLLMREPGATYLVMPISLTG